MRAGSWVNEVRPATSRSQQRTVHIGVSGWKYAPWRGEFYPPGLTPDRELAFAASHFSSLEVNGTFYSLKRPQDFARWRDETPPGFVFAIKGSRYITHMLKLTNVQAALANFCAQGLLQLGPKLGPILWQFPPTLRFDAGRFSGFIEQLPRDTDALRALACRHDARLKGRSALRVRTHQVVRHAIEIRHDSFRSPEFVHLLRKWGVALVCADSVDWPFLMDLTADFVYCRLHGSAELYVSGYDEEALDQWGRRVRTWARGAEPREPHRVLPPSPPDPQGRDVYLYFDNDAKVRAPADAQSLVRRVPGTARAQGACAIGPVPVASPFAVTAGPMRSRPSPRQRG
jgi:uncharacterized protein YecE (DUF72 family)